MEDLIYTSGGTLNALSFVVFYRPSLNATRSDYIGLDDEKFSFSLQVSPSMTIVPCFF
jgi:hypothetical protein